MGDGQKLSPDEQVRSAFEAYENGRDFTVAVEEEYPPERAPLTSFSNGDVAELRDKLAALLALPDDERASLGEAARRAAVSRWSWASVAQRLLAEVT